MLGALAGIVTWRAPMWLVVSAALLCVGFASSWLGLACGFVALVGTLTWALRSRWSASLADSASESPFAGVTTSTIVSGTLFASTLSLQDGLFPYASAVVAAAIWGAATVSTLPTFTRRQRIGLAVVGVTGIVGVSILGIGAAMELRDSYNLAKSAEASLRQATSLARRGEIDAARTSLDHASLELGRADAGFSSPVLSAVKQFPFASQNLTAAQETISPAAGVLRAASDTALGSDELGNLFNDGGFSVDEAVELATGTEHLLRSLGDFQETLTTERSHWVLPALDDALAETANEAAVADDFADLKIVEGVRGLLGADEPRSYLLLFGNTAEARELGGFAGGTALIIVEDGQITLERADRPSALTRTSPRVLQSPTTQRFFEHHPWLFSQNYTAMADFPTLATSLAELYPHMGGTEIDGVLYLDPQVLAALVGLVGEVHLEESAITVTPDNVSQLVHIEQYARFDDRDSREAFLSEMVTAIFRILLSDRLEPSLAAIEPLLDAVREDRLLFVPFDGAAFDLVEAADMVGGVPVPRGQDYLAVSHLNGGPNKLDVYLQRDVVYDVEIDATSGRLDAVLTVTLSNDCLLYTSPSPRDRQKSRMPSSA